jgi:hypothetical protein
MRARALLGVVGVAALASGAGFLLGTSHGASVAERAFAGRPTQTPVVVVHLVTRTVVKTVAPVATPTPVPSPIVGVAPNEPGPTATRGRTSGGGGNTATGNPHICLFSDFDQTNVRCIKDDNNIDLTDQENAVLAWDYWSAGTDSNGDPRTRDTFNVLKQDGTGAWVQVGSATMGTNNPIQNYYDDSTPRKYIKISDVFSQTGVNTDCNSSFKIQLAEFLGPTDGSVPINFTC